MAVVWNYENAAHLLRRAAFGGTPDEINAFLNKYSSVSEAVDALVNFPVSNKKPPRGSRDFYRAKIKQRQFWLKTMLKPGDPGNALREKMVLFWHGHLCSGYSKQYETLSMPLQNGLFRRFANGNFRDLVREFNRDPANLHYLDGLQNYASADGYHVAANENFGRELMELFTLGISQFAADGTNDPSKPNYTEDDVHQMARALTGWVSIEHNVGVWKDWAWDGGRYDDHGGVYNTGDPVVPDPVTIFGITNNNFKIGAEVAGTADDVLKLIFERQDSDGNIQSAMFLSRKLWTWFAYPAPAAGLKAMLADFANTFATNNFELKPLLTAMFNHDEFYSDAAKTRTVKNPVDYMVGLLRGLGVKSVGRTFGSSGQELGDMLIDMGMELFEPPNVAGWPGGRRWITTGTLVSRLDFARQLAESESGMSALLLETIVPIGSKTTDPGVVVDAILQRIGLDDTGGGAASVGGVALTSGQRAALIDFLTAGGTKTTIDLSNSSTDDARTFVRGTIALALQSAEAQIF